MTDMKVVAVDLDGTLLRGNSMLGFIAALPGGFKALTSIPGQWARGRRGGDLKIAYMERLLLGRSQDELESVSQEHARSMLVKTDSVIRHRLEEAKSEGAEIFIVSASLECYVVPFAQLLGMEAVATPVDYLDGKVVSLGPNCSGEEKVKRLDQVLQGRPLSAAYGDSVERDGYMLEAAERGFFVKHTRRGTLVLPHVR